MKFQELHHDDAVLAELGRRLAQVRIDLNLTQAELAEKAGVGKRTLERLEAGETTQTRTLFRILRELDLLPQLELLVPEPKLGPRRIVKENAGLPQRASKRGRVTKAPDVWKWGDEE